MYSLIYYVLQHLWVPSWNYQQCLAYKIMASEGKDATSNKYWLNQTVNGKTELMFCDMNLGNGGWPVSFHSNQFPSKSIFRLFVLFC